MAGRRNPKRWVIKRLGAVASATGYELATRSEQPDKILSALWALECSGHISRDPYDHHYRLTDRGQDTLMRLRNKSKADPNAPADLAEERARLIQEFHGPHALAIIAVEDDDILSERLAIAIGNGLPVIVLGDVPNHRRAAAVEDALDAFNYAVAGGPCSYCGTRERRASGVPVSYLDQPEIPGFTTRGDGSTACAWCQNMLVDHNLDSFRDRIFNAVVGVRGIPVVGEYRAAPAITPFAYEVGYSGTPWGHLTANTQDAQVYRTAMRMRAEEVVHRSRFCRFEGESSVPGIVSPAWPDPPRQPLRQFRPLAAAIAYEEETIRFREECDRKAREKEINLRNRLAKIETEASREERWEQAIQERARALGVL